MRMLDILQRHLTTNVTEVTLGSSLWQDLYKMTLEDYIYEKDQIVGSAEALNLKYSPVFEGLKTGQLHLPGYYGTVIFYRGE